MNARFLIPIMTFALLMVSCNKKGCTDKHALNYSADATKDDGSCRPPKNVRILGVELRVLKPFDDNGVEWDWGGLPDCFIQVTPSWLPFISTYTTPVIEDVSPEDNHVFNIIPNIVIPIDSLNDHTGFHFSVYDKDSTIQDLMARGSLDLPAQPAYGSYFSTDFLKRYKLYNRTINSNGESVANNHVSITVLLEWE